MCLTVYQSCIDNGYLWLQLLGHNGLLQIPACHAEAIKAFPDGSLLVSSLLLTGCSTHASTARLTGIAAQASLCLAHEAS